MSIKIGIFGSAFNPPTMGHANAILQVRDKFDEIWMVPSFSHAFGKQMVDFDLRCKLVDAFSKEMVDNYGVKVKGEYCERDIAKDGKPVYSLDLLSHLTQKHPGCEFILIIGKDNEDNFDAFYRSAEIKEKWSLSVVQDIVNIRSTLVRNLIKEGKAIDEVVFPLVKDVIFREGIDKSYI
ncbi:hypothetical protein EN12_20420 [Vibrio cholerae]|uniref:nicotinate-nucleotide adenylyltransferase n=1 Tax=Vibrio cholerae TaxID=666 RepID=A0A5B1C7B1_VIBCL|nr:nicotinate-nicotinamide nucleotide adenylyltransferase [Vibrio cholerae]AKO77536.1 hypothetical protein EN12_20420 [Vibrio cholerae]KAA1255244.1 nicotinate-nicotinamide nucleotide adenylyltransferase [Vibrio cholerae]